VKSVPVQTIIEMRESFLETQKTRMFGDDQKNDSCLARSAFWSRAGFLWRFAGEPGGAGDPDCGPGLCDADGVGAHGNDHACTNRNTRSIADVYADRHTDLLSLADPDIHGTAHANSDDD
jgi:hypothetical protein